MKKAWPLVCLVLLGCEKPESKPATEREAYEAKVEALCKKAGEGDFMVNAEGERTLFQHPKKHCQKKEACQFPVLEALRAGWYSPPGDSTAVKTVGSGEVKRLSFGPGQESFARLESSISAPLFSEEVAVQCVSHCLEEGRTCFADVKRKKH